MSKALCDISSAHDRDGGLPTAGYLGNRKLASESNGHGALVAKAEVFADADAAVAGIEDGSTVLVGGFGFAGMPFELIDALIRQGARDLTIVSNNAGNADIGLAALLGAGRVRKVLCSFPRQIDSYVFDELYHAGEIELELVAQGNLAERMRAAGAGIGAFYCPTGVGTSLAEGKESRTIDGREYLLEYPIRGDYALISAHQADPMGNLVYWKTARNFGPIMATAATTTIVQVGEIVALGSLDPEAVVTPSIYVERIVQVNAQRHTVGETASKPVGETASKPVGEEKRS